MCHTLPTTGIREKTVHSSNTYTGHTRTHTLSLTLPPSLPLHIHGENILHTTLQPAWHIADKKVQRRFMNVPWRRSGIREGAFCLTCRWEPGGCSAMLGETQSACCEEENCCKLGARGTVTRTRDRQNQWVRWEVDWKPKWQRLEALFWMWSRTPLDGKQEWRGNKNKKGEIGRKRLQTGELTGTSDRNVWNSSIDSLGALKD